MKEEATKETATPSNVDPKLDALFGDNTEARSEPSEEVVKQMNPLPE